MDVCYDKNRVQPVVSQEFAACLDDGRIPCFGCGVGCPWTAKGRACFKISISHRLSLSSIFIALLESGHHLVAYAQAEVPCLAVSLLQFFANHIDITHPHPNRIYITQRPSPRIRPDSSPPYSSHIAKQDGNIFDLKTHPSGAGGASALVAAWAT